MNYSNILDRSNNKRPGDDLSHVQPEQKRQKTTLLTNLGKVIELSSREGDDFFDYATSKADKITELFQSLCFEMVHDPEAKKTIQSFKKNIEVIYNKALPLQRIAPSITSEVKKTLLHLNLPPSDHKLVIDGQEIAINKSLIAASSPYFAGVFKTDQGNTQTKLYNPEAIYEFSNYHHCQIKVADSPNLTFSTVKNFVDAVTGFYCIEDEKDIYHLIGLLPTLNFFKAEELASQVETTIIMLFADLKETNPDLAVQTFHHIEERLPEFKNKLTAKVLETEGIFLYPFSSHHLLQAKYNNFSEKDRLEMIQDKEQLWSCRCSQQKDMFTFDRLKFNETTQATEPLSSRFGLTKDGWVQANTTDEMEKISPVRPICCATGSEWRELFASEKYNWKYTIFPQGQGG